MAKYDPNTREQIIQLSDGRQLFKTHNGFKCFLETSDGVIPVTQEYYTNIMNRKAKYSKDLKRIKSLKATRIG